MRLFLSENGYRTSQDKEGKDSEEKQSRRNRMLNSHGLPFFETRMPNIWRLACSEAFASKRVVWGDTVTVLARNAILLVGTREKQSRPTGCACSPTGSGGDFLRVPDTNHHPILPEIMQ